MNGRYAPLNSPNPMPPPFTGQIQQDVNGSDQPRNHVRDFSGSRGRGPALPNIAISNTQAQQSKSPRSQSSVGAGRSPSGLNGTLERRPSATHNHYRQPSRAHSNYPQSRNAIFVASPTTSPLSPETPGSSISSIAPPDISNNTMVRRQTSVRYPGEMPNATLSGSTLVSTSSATSNADREHGDTVEGTQVQKRLDRTHGKSRSGHSHHRSQSRHHHEQKSVGEYALHHLFNKVSTTFYPLHRRSDTFNSLSYGPIRKSSNVPRAMPKWKPLKDIVEQASMLNWIN